MRVIVIGHSYMVDVNQKKLDCLSALKEVKVGLIAPKSWREGSWRKRFVYRPYFSSFQQYTSTVLFEGRAGAYLYPTSFLRRVFDSFQPQLVHIEQEVFALSALQLSIFARLYNLPIVVFGWENVDRPLGFRQWSVSMVLRMMSMFIGGSSGAIALIRQWGYKGPVSVLPQFGVDTLLFQPGEVSPKPEPFVAGFAGRLVKEKGVDVLIEALNVLRSKNYNIKLLICGTGPEQEQLAYHCRNLGIFDYVEFLPALAHSQVPEFMRRLHVLVLPSRSVPRWKEQFGRVIIEAMACGVPVVGSDCGAIPEVIGRNDLIFPEGDAAALASILEKLILSSTESNGYWNAVRAYGLARVQERFSMERVAIDHVDIWKQVLSKEGYRRYN